MGQLPLIQPAFNIEYVANGVLNPITNRTIKKHHKLIDKPLLCEVLMKAMYVKLGRLSQG